MAKRRKPSVLYVGDWVFHMGPEFVESPFYRPRSCAASPTGICTACRPASLKPA